MRFDSLQDHEFRRDEWAAQEREAAKDRTCYWCKHPHHGRDVCPVPHLAIGDNSHVGESPCGCVFCDAD